MMSEESTTSDLVELTREAFEAVNRHDLDALMGFYADDAVFDLSAAGIGIFAGVDSIRGFVQDWWKTWGDHLAEAEEVQELGHGVVFASLRETGRLIGSAGQVEQLAGWVLVWERAMIERQAGYLAVAEARDVAERLAWERG